MEKGTRYDAVITGAGHNGLIAACYLALAGRRVLVLEKNAVLGGATRSEAIFPGVAARVSVYSYLVSLLPQQIISDLGLNFHTLRRAIASYSPVERDGQVQGLLISNRSEDATRQSFAALTGSDREYRGYRQLQETIAIFARKVWPTLLVPMPSKEALQAQFRTPDERRAWEYLVEQPLSALIEAHLADDTVRGAVFTNAKIGVATYPDDPTRLQNRTFLYHVIGQGTGEWRVPVGGMGALIAALEERAWSLGVTIETGAEVRRVTPGASTSEVVYEQGEQERAVSAGTVLFNTSADIANRCLPGAVDGEQVEGAVFKLNMVLKRLPRLRDPRVSAQDAFTGTFHLIGGYEGMKASYRQSQGDTARAAGLPGEMYCHSLTDPSILSPELQTQGYHSLTLFGMDVPYRWFREDNDRVKAEITGAYVRSINHFLAEDLYDCLATDVQGNLCIEAKSPRDLETSLGLPQGNIFHGNLTWPFAEQEEHAGSWGVETNYENVYLCGSGAKRGGAVSGIPGHNAAMKVLGIS